MAVPLVETVFDLVMAALIPADFRYLTTAAFLALPRAFDVPCARTDATVTFTSEPRPIELASESRASFCRAERVDLPALKDISEVAEVP